MGEARRRVVCLPRGSRIHPVEVDTRSLSPAFSGSHTSRNSLKRAWHSYEPRASSRWSTMPRGVVDVEAPMPRHQTDLSFGDAVLAVTRKTCSIDHVYMLERRSRIRVMNALICCGVATGVSISVHDCNSVRWSEVRLCFSRPCMLVVALIVALAGDHRGTRGNCPPPERASR